MKKYTVTYLDGKTKIAKEIEGISTARKFARTFVQGERLISFVNEKGVHLPV